MNELEYWKERSLIAEKIIDKYEELTFDKVLYTSELFDYLKKLNEHKAKEPVKAFLTKEQFSMLREGHIVSNNDGYTYYLTLHCVYRRPLTLQPDHYPIGLEIVKFENVPWNIKVRYIDITANILKDMSNIIV